MKNWIIVKCALYIVLSILIFIFRFEIVENIKYLIGFLMIAYGAEQVLIHILTRKTIGEANSFFWGIMELVLSFVVLLFVNDYSSICLVWAIWSILRETNEIEEIIIKIIHHKTNVIAFIFSLVESLVAITFLIMLIIHPGPEHAYTHILLLVVELITTAVFPFIEKIQIKNKN